MQAQVDFARFAVEFSDKPGLVRIVWLFNAVLKLERRVRHDGLVAVCGNH